MKKKNLWIIILALFVGVDLIAMAFLLLSGPHARKTDAAEPTEPYDVFTEPFTIRIQYEDETLASTSTADSPPIEQDDALTISFVGDCMFASNHGAFNGGSFNATARYASPDYFLNNFSEMFHADDLTIANCECVLSDDDTLEEKEVTTEIAFWFKGPARHAEIFTAGGVDFAGVVNNHSHDFGQKGSDDTVAALKAAGLLVGERGKVTYTTIKGVKIGVHCCSLYSYDYIYDILDKLREMDREDCDLRILYFHGGIENETQPEDWKVRACRKLIEAGADIICGAHPHVLQPMEIYRNCPIVYSLGNFCFGGNTHPPKDTAVYQAVYALKDGKPIYRKDVFIPCQTYSGGQNNYQPFIVTGAGKRQQILDFLYSPIEF